MPSLRRQSLRRGASTSASPPSGGRLAGRAGKETTQAAPGHSGLCSALPISLRNPAHSHYGLICDLEPENTHEICPFDSGSWGNEVDRGTRRACNESDMTEHLTLFHFVLTIYKSLSYNLFYHLSKSSHLHTAVSTLATPIPGNSSEHELWLCPTNTIQLTWGKKAILQQESSMPSPWTSLLTQ